MNGGDGWGPDEFLVRLLAGAPEEWKPILSAAFGAADIAARHCPAYAVPSLIRASWLQALATTAEDVGNPDGRALRWAADRATLEVGLLLASLIPQIPDDARDIGA